ncbi:MAG: Xaa-Pro aminopeptidase [Xanthomonadales bacterium]|nr:Xaa-Pro aminopeptidase [Xanthomonadales bacterium]
MINQKEFARRRRQLMRTVGEGAMVVVPAAPVRQRNSDVEYPYRQSSDFHYLCGFPEPDAVLVLIPGRAQGESVLFCREKDPERETWDGPMVGLEDACSEFGMDDSFPYSDIDDILPNLMEGRERLYYSLGREKDFDQRVLEWVAKVRQQVGKGARPPEEFVSLDHHLHDMRLYKSRSEIASMSRSAKIAGEGHLRAMRACRPGVTEYELTAELLFSFHRHQAQPSYQPIVGGGANACVLHYIRNSEPLNDGDLVLIDAGAEYDHYASDITRTFPVNGRFTTAQRDIYQVVLEAQEAAIAAVQPGNSCQAPHDAAVKVIRKGLAALGITTGRGRKKPEGEAYRKYFMHKTSHWLGMDVHDVGDYQIDGHPRELEVGMALTVEPGVYIQPDARVPKAFRGIGIRIEDDVVVTRNGPRVLSSGVAKTVDEIESVMA